MFFLFWWVAISCLLVGSLLFLLSLWLVLFFFHQLFLTMRVVALFPGGFLLFVLVVCYGLDYWQRLLSLFGVGDLFCFFFAHVICFHEWRENKRLLPFSFLGVDCFVLVVC